jgi:hypothetical protein
MIGLFVLFLIVLALCFLAALVEVIEIGLAWLRRRALGEEDE